MVGDESKNTGVFLLLPPSLKMPSPGPSCNKSVPPLLELSLRMAYKLSYNHIIEKDDSTGVILVSRTPSAFRSEIYHSLPLLLLHRLNMGPTVMCYYCEHPVFVFGVLWVIHHDCYNSDSDPDVFCVLSTIVFCSVSCSLLFSERDQLSTSVNRLARRKLKWFPCK